MTLMLAAYKTLMRITTPIVPLVFKHRSAKGKELPGRLHQRQARNMAARSPGTLIWMHGASLGESKLLLGLADAMRNDPACHSSADFHLLFTSQTVSSSQILKDALPGNAQHQMLPVDSPAAAKRFIAHWKPDLCIFAEGEIWPNLLIAAKAHGSKLALVNARMTDKSLKGWQKASKTARKVFGTFDLILAADTRTEKGLTLLGGQNINRTGNLKTALAARHATAPTTHSSAPTTLADQHKILLGASTHEGEEALLLNVLKMLPETTRLIIAPRHPDRADQIEALIKQSGMSYTRRSHNRDAELSTKILLADTFGEMSSWYSLADAVYLGGGHKPGIGGHSPLEPLAFGLPVLTGPHTDNFKDTYTDLQTQNWTHIVKDAQDIVDTFPKLKPLSKADIDAFFNTGSEALTQTLDGLSALLAKKAAS